MTDTAAIWKEINDVIGNMANEARLVHRLTHKEPSFKEITELCGNAEDILGDACLALAELKDQGSE